MPASAQSTRLFEQTVTVTLVGKGWSQVRNDQVLKGLADHDVDISNIEGVWKDSRHRHLHVTFASPEQTQKATLLRTFQIGEVTATIRGRSNITEVKVHFVPGWMSTEAVAGFLGNYGELLNAEHIYTEHHGVRMKTGTVALQLKTNHPRAIPLRIEVEHQSTTTLLMVNVRGQPIHCWTCGAEGHPSARCEDRFERQQDDDTEGEETEDELEEAAESVPETQEVIPETQQDPNTQLDQDPPVSPSNSTPGLSTPSDSILQGVVSQVLPDTETQTDNTDGTTSKTGKAATFMQLVKDGMATMKRRSSARSPEEEDQARKRKQERSPSEDLAHAATQELLQREKEEKTKEEDETRRNEIMEFYKQTNRWTPEREKKVREADTLLLQALHCQLKDLAAQDQTDAIKARPEGRRPTFKTMRSSDMEKEWEMPIGWNGYQGWG